MQTTSKKDNLKNQTTLIIVNQPSICTVQHPLFYTPKSTPSTLHPSTFSLTVEVGVWHGRNPSCFGIFFVRIGIRKIGKGIVRVGKVSILFDKI